MKILQVIPYFCFGGAETMCENLTYALTAMGHDVTVVSLISDRTPIAGRMEENGIRIHYLDKKLGLDLSMIPRLIRIMQKEKPDVVHTHLNVIKYAAIAARLCGIRCVHTVHNVAHEEAEGRLQKITNTIYFRRGWAVPVALSPKVRETILSFYGLKEEQVPMIYNGVDLGKCCPKEKHTVGKPARLLHVGRFNEQKNHKGLLDAFAQIVKVHPDCCLQLIGDGELEEETKRYTQHLGLQENVIFLGNQTNVYPFLQKADVFLLPSRFEGMPMTIIEAMGTGLPIVASAVGGVPDMLEDGVSGLLVPCDPEATARAVLQLLKQEDLREKLGANALESSRKFSAAHMARCYLDVYSNSGECL